MTPQTAQMAAVAVVAVFQLLSAMRVMRATAERPDLTGLSRFVPILLALFVPVIGPFIAGRATDAGIRPTLLSAVGLAAGFGLYAFLGAPTAPPPRVQVAGVQPQPTDPKPVAEGQPADPALNTTAAEPAATPAEGEPAPPVAEEPKPAAPATEATQPAAEPAAAEPKPAPQPAEEPKPAAPPPAAPAAATVAAAPPAADAVSVETGAAPVAAVTGFSAVEFGTATAEALPQAGPPVALTQRRVQAEAQIALPGADGAGGYINEYLSRTPVNHTRLLFAASIAAPPRSFLTPQVCLGGKVLYFNELADVWDPYLVPPNQAVDGQTIYLTSRGGNYLAEVRFGEVTRDETGQVRTAALDVRIR